MAEMKAVVTLELREKLKEGLKKIVGAVKQVKSELKGLDRTQGGREMARNFSRAEVQARKLRLEMHKLKTAMASVKTQGGQFLKRIGLAGGGLMAAKGVIDSAIVAGIIGPTAQFEEYRTLLKGAEESSDEGKAAFAWVKDFAKKTPFQVGEVLQAYIRLKRNGIDPTDGSLRILGDTAAASGKNVLDAIEAISDAETGENERLKESFGIKARIKDGEITYSYRDRKGVARQAKADAENRDEIRKTILGILDEKYKGSMDDLSKTWKGKLSNLEDAWTNFRVMIGESGPMELLKQKLQGVLDELDMMEKDGRLKAWAEAIGTHLTATLEKLAAIATGAWTAIQQVAIFIQKLADAVGGYENLGYFAVGLYLVSKSLELIIALKEAATILTTISAVGTGGAASGFMKLAGGIGALVAGLYAIQQFEPDIVGGLESWRPPPREGENRQPLVKPAEGDFHMIGTAIAGSLGQITREWVIKLFNDAMSAISQALSSFVALVKQYASQIKDAFVEGLGNLFEAGVQWVSSLWDGIKAKAGELKAYVAGLGSELKNSLSSAFTIGGAGSNPNANPANFPNAQSGAPSGPSNWPGNTPAPQPRALGGSIYRGGSYITGERGPELITAGRSGHVTPNSKLKGLLGQGGPTINLGGITINGQADKRTIAALGHMLESTLRRALHDGAYA